MFYFSVEPSQSGTTFTLIILLISLRDRLQEPFVEAREFVMITWSQEVSIHLLVYTYWTESEISSDTTGHSIITGAV